MLIPYEEALERTLRGVTRLGVERVALPEALGRVMAEDVVASRPMPAFPYSAMDGYALRVSHLAGEGPWTLPVRGESRAGRPGPPLEAGCASRIFTGAAIPVGANAVVIQEDVERTGDRIRISERPHEGQNIRPMGVDLARGATALAAGTRVHPGRLGLLAALDRAFVAVARRPVVAILGTGDELRAPGEPGPEGSIAESNSFVIAALAARIGAVARVMPWVGDDVERTERELGRALRGADLVVTIGGASVGEHDLVRPALEAAGARIEYWGVAIKPGKPTALAALGGARVLVLPGNPASATLTFSLLGIPLLRAMQGERDPSPRRIPLRIVGSHQRRPGREEYLRARLALHDGELCALLSPGQSSGAVTSFAEADALVVLAADRARIDHGDRLPVIALSELWGG